MEKLNWDNVENVDTGIFTVSNTPCEWKEGICDKPAKLRIMVYNIEETGKNRMKMNVCTKHYKKLAHTSELIANEKPNG